MSDKIKFIIDNLFKMLGLSLAFSSIIIKLMLVYNYNIVTIILSFIMTIILSMSILYMLISLIIFIMTKDT